VRKLKTAGIVHSENLDDMMRVCLFISLGIGVSRVNYGGVIEFQLIVFSQMTHRLK